jgi:hypothetical protein
MGILHLIAISIAKLFVFFLSPIIATFIFFYLN